MIDDVLVCVVGSKFECEPTLSLNLASGVVYYLLILPRVLYNAIFVLNFYLCMKYDGYSNNL